MSNKNKNIGKMALNTGKELAKTPLRTLNAATTVTKHGLAGVSEASKAQVLVKLLVMLLQLVMQLLVF